MNKEIYQKSLNKIVRSSCPNCYDDNGCLNCNIKEHCNAPAKYWVDTLQKLIDQQFNPTLDECIKEWEDAGWYYSTSKEYGNHIFYKDGTYIKIFKRESIYNNSYIKESYYADCEGPLIAKPILPKEHNLIHKTLKALEVEKHVD